jgi:hypothetical protein
MKDGRMMEDKIKKSETNQLQIALPFEEAVAII